MSPPDCGSSAGPRLVHVDPGDRRWLEFVAAHPDALVYHHPAWFELLSQVCGHRPIALGCQDGTGRLTGILPLLHGKGLFTGARFVSLPFTPTAGPLAADPASLRTLASAAVALAEQSAAKALELRVAGPSPDGLLDAGFTRVRRSSTYVMDLPADPEQIRFGSPKNHSRIRWAVRKSHRQGVVVREASSQADLRSWYRLYLGTMRAHAAPPRPFELFRLMWEMLAPRQLFRLLLAERRAGGAAELLAGSVFLLHKDRIIYAYNGRDAAALRHRPNDAIHWHAIADACRSGLRRYDFGEVSDGNGGLADFKEKWGARPADVHRYYYPRLRKGPQGAAKPSVARHAADWAWRRLPLPVTAEVSRWIDRCL